MAINFLSLEFRGIFLTDVIGGMINRVEIIKIELTKATKSMENVQSI